MTDQYNLKKALVQLCKNLTDCSCTSVKLRSFSSLIETDLVWSWSSITVSRTRMASNSWSWSIVDVPLSKSSRSLLIAKLQSVTWSLSETRELFDRRESVSEFEPLLTLWSEPILRGDNLGDLIAVMSTICTKPSLVSCNFWFADLKQICFLCCNQLQRATS